MRVLVVVAAALVLAPAAMAWTQVGSGVSNSADPAVLGGLVAYSTGSQLRVVRGGGTTILGTGAFVGDPRLVRTPGGTILLFVGTENGVVSYASSDGGASWSGPSAPLPSSRVDDVQGAAVRADGTPLVSQDGTDFIDVWTGTSRQNVFAYCCGYGESLAVDSGGAAHIAFWSNATGQSGYLYGPLGGPYTNLSGGAGTVSRTDRVPLVSDARGDSFVAWTAGYPEAQTLYVQALPAATRAAVAHGFSGGDPHISLAVDSRDRLWAAWTWKGSVYAAHSCTAAAHFGPATTALLPGTAYALEADAAGTALSVVVNTGSALQEQQLKPRLAAGATKKTATVLDDRCGVAGARLSGGGRTAQTNAQGRASLKGFRGGTRVRVIADGYVGTSFRVP